MYSSIQVCNYAYMETKGKLQPSFGKSHAYLRQISGKYQPCIRKIFDISQTYPGKSLGKSRNISGIFAYLFTIIILYHYGSTILYLFYLHYNCASRYDPRTCFLCRAKFPLLKAMKIGIPAILSVSQMKRGEVSIFIFKS